MIDSITLIHSFPIDPRRLWNKHWRLYGTQEGRDFRGRFVHIGGKVPSAYFAYDVGRRELVVGHTSLPRVYQGHNAVLLSDRKIAEAVAALDVHVADALAIDRIPQVADVPSLWNWRVRKIDIAFDFKPSKVSHSVAMAALFNLQPTGKMTAIRYGHSTVYFRAPSKRFHIELRIYDKGPEALKTYGAGIASLAAGTIRLELALRNQAAVRRAVGFADNRLANVAVRPLLMAALRRKLAQLHVSDDYSTVPVGEDYLIAKFGSGMGRALWLYYRDRQCWTDPQLASKWGVKLETIRRYSRELRSIGHFPAYAPVAGVHEELLDAIKASETPADGQLVATQSDLEGADLELLDNQIVTGESADATCDEVAESTVIQAVPSMPPAVSPHAFLRLSVAM